MNVAVQPCADNASLHLFHVNFPERDLVELRRRIKATRWPAREAATQDVQVRCRVESRPANHVLDPAREFPIGSHIVPHRRGYTHHGIYMGERRVVQYDSLSLVLHRGPVEEVCLSQFTQGRETRVRFDGSSDFHYEEVIYRARLRPGENRYHPLKNNWEQLCERSHGRLSHCNGYAARGGVTVVSRLLRGQNGMHLGGCNDTELHWEYC